MDTLLPNSINKILANWESLHQSLDVLCKDDQSFPVEIEGLQGCLYTFYTAEYVSDQISKIVQFIQYSAVYRRTSKNSSVFGVDTSADFVLIVPTEKDADDVYIDLEAAFLDRPVSIFKLPSWAVMPYRPVAKGAVTFGERAGVLSKLAERRPISSVKITPRIFILTQRVFQIPVPPPDYIRSLVFPLNAGQKLDTVDLASRLVKNGYTRVPRVSVRGEFTLRGEVLDLYMPGEEYANRIVFNFDKIDYIKTFDPETQSTLNSVDTLLIYPMKEVIWTDELITKLNSRLQSMDNAGIGSVDEQGISAAGEAHLALTYGEATLRTIRKEGK